MSDVGVAGSPGKANEKPPVEVDGLLKEPPRPDVSANEGGTLDHIAANNGENRPGSGTSNNDANKAK